MPRRPRRRPPHSVLLPDEDRPDQTVVWLLRALLYRANLRHREALGKARAFPILDMPVRVIWGEVDAALDITLIRDMDDLFRGPFDVCTIPDCGHWVQQEEPGLVNRYLLEFLGSEDNPL